MPKNGFKKKLLTVPNLGKIYTVKYQIWGNSAAALRGLWQPSPFQFHQKRESTETAMLSTFSPLSPHIECGQMFWGWIGVPETVEHEPLVSPNGRECSALCYTARAFLHCITLKHYIALHCYISLYCYIILHYIATLHYTVTHYHIAMHHHNTTIQHSSNLLY